MANLFRNILKLLAYAGATGVMLLALIVGIVRLMLPLVPEYQDVIRGWAAGATGFDVQFENISASWPIAGPQLQFIDVIVSSQDTGERVFVADNLSVGISPLILIRDRKVLLNRLGVEGSKIRIRRDADGNYLFQDRPLDEYLKPESGAEEPLRLPDLFIELSDIDASFADDSRSDDEYNFDIERLEIQLSAERIKIDGELKLAPEFGSHATVSTDLPARLLRSDADSTRNINPRSVIPAAQEWRIYFVGRELKFRNILEYAFQREVPVRQAHGSITVAAGFRERRLQSITGELDLADIDLRIDPDRTESFKALSGQFEWAREGDDGWLLAGTEISFEPLDLFAPRSDFFVAMQPAASGSGRNIRASAGFLRLDNLYPFVQLAEKEGLLVDTLPEGLQLPRDIRGEVRNLHFGLQRADAAPGIFNADFQFVDLAVDGAKDDISVRGISGELAADQDGGHLMIDGQAAEVDMPALFTAPIQVQKITGLLDWRVTDDVIHVLSDNVRVRMSFLEGDTHFAFDWPRNGDSPQIDLTANAVAADARRVIPLLPLKIFPPPVADWLDRAILAGRITRADIMFSGPLREFPFDGDQGVFKVDLDVEGAVLDYAEQWPRVENIDARVVFDGVSLGSERNTGRVGRINFRDSTVRIADLRKGLLEISGRQPVPINAALDFLQRSPVAAAIGPVIDKVTGVGAVNADLRLALSVLHPTEYELDIAVDANGINLDMTGLDWGLSDLRGTLMIRNTQLHASGMTATLLDEPITLDLHPAGDASDLYGQFIRIAGRTPVERWMQTLSLPYADRVAGPADWNALVLIPQRQSESRPPVHIIVRSDIVGVENRMPAPLAKPSGVARAFEVDVAFPDEGRLEVSGRLRPDLTWTFELESVKEAWKISRGAVHAGTATAIVPSGDGVEVSGHLNEMNLDDWLALAGDSGAESGQADWQETWREAVIDIDQFSAFGQQFADVQLDASQDEMNWRIMLKGPAIAGQIMVPLDLDAGRPIVMNMERLWFMDADTEAESAGEDDGDSADPREIPSIEVEVADFVLKDMHFGSLSTKIRSVAGGVLVAPIRMQAPTFTVEGDGAWLVHPNDDTLRQTRLALNLNGTDISAMLAALGYEPVIDGKSIVASGALTWIGGPAEDFLQRADGKFSISMKEGSLLSVEPGGGRILGVLSLASLPRRLSLDFSDVFDDGLGFDTLSGDFTVDNGNAYTCNLGMEGSVADMGVVGRSGLEAHDYDQLAVVRPHMSNLLAVGGVVVGGPVAGAAMLLFSQVFHKPLSTLGESYYRISGSWDDPAVEQIRGNDLDVAPLRNCEKFLSEALTESLKE